MRKVCDQLYGYQKIDVISLNANEQTSIDEPLVNLVWFREDQGHERHQEENQLHHRAAVKINNPIEQNNICIGET